MSIPEIESVIESMFEATQALAMDYLRPILQSEFDLVRGREPRLKRIMFGNGTFAFEFEGPVTLNWGRRGEMPGYAHRLWELASIAGCYSISVEGFIDNDITAED